MIVALQIAGMRWRGVILKRVTAALLLPVLLWNMYLVLFGNKDASLIALEGFVVELESAVTCTVVLFQQDKHRQQPLGLLPVQYFTCHSPLH